MAANNLLRIVQILSKTTVGKRASKKLLTSPLLQKTVIRDILKSPTAVVTRAKEVDQLTNILSNLENQVQKQIRQTTFPDLKHWKQLTFLVIL